MVILHGFPRRGIVMDKEEFNKFLDESNKNVITKEFTKECEEDSKIFKKE